MKKLLTLSIALLFILVSTSASDSPIILSSKISRVTVFQSGAQVFRTAYKNVNAGIHTLSFEGLSPYIQPNSIQLNGKGNFTILEVKYQVRYKNPELKTQKKPDPSVDKRIKVLEDSITELNFLLQEVTDYYDVLSMEKNILINNKTMKGEGQTDSLPVLKDALTYFRTRMDDINKRILENRREKYQIEQEKIRVNQDLSKLRQYKNSMANQSAQPSAAIHCVDVVISAEKAVATKLTLSYMVANASWSAFYDFRVNHVDEPIEVVYKAKVMQETGENWKDVKLTLSTLNPNRSNHMPVLSAWYINYFMSVTTLSNFGMDVSAASSMAKKQKMLDVEEVQALQKKEYDEPARSTSSYTTVNTNFSNIEFSIDINYSIPADGQQHAVAIKKDEIPATYQYTIIPKVNRESFLIARLTDWEKLNMLKGPVSLYFEGTYVGQSYINPQVLDDTLRLSMSADPGVYAERKKIEDSEKVQSVGSNKVKTIEIELVIRNTKSTAVKINVEDQIPVAAVDDIKVEILDIGGAELTESTGALKWTIDLEPLDSKKLRFSYIIKYDKNRSLRMY